RRRQEQRINGRVALWGNQCRRRQQFRLKRGFDLWRKERGRRQQKGINFALNDSVRCRLGGWFENRFHWQRGGDSVAGGFKTCFTGGCCLDDCRRQGLCIAGRAGQTDGFGGRGFGRGGFARGLRRG